ncbi:MAG: SprB repeat-containing protein [Cyclobacteriaceae bacterium]|nr:SprB repeat-containing protein [Cyclobacteriaceae bacterium]
MKQLLLVLSSITLLLSCVSHDLNRTIDCDQANLAIETTAIVPATSCGTEDGSITVVGSGGKQPFTYILPGTPSRTSTNGVFQNLSAGLYSVTLRDKNGCEKVLDYILIGATQFDASFTLTEDNLCLEDNGGIKVAVAETNGPYAFKLDAGEFTASAIFTEVKSGKHFLTIRDSDNCEVVLEVNVPRGNTGVSWATDILPIMTNSCATTGCHNGIDRMDWRIYANAKTHAADIKKRTQDKSMPFNGGLPQNQIDLIACWVDDGAPEN